MWCIFVSSFKIIYVYYSSVILKWLLKIAVMTYNELDHLIVGMWLLVCLIDCFISQTNIDIKAEQTEQNFTIINNNGQASNDKVSVFILLLWLNYIP